MTLTVLAFEAGSSEAFARARVTRLGGESGMSAVFLRFCVAGMGAEFGEIPFRIY